MIVGCYGLHTDTKLGVRYLIQDGVPKNVIGLKNTPDIQVQMSYPQKCVHNIDMQMYSEFYGKAKIKSDPLILHTAPLPNKSSAFIVNSGELDDLLFMCARLQAPTETIIKPIWMADEKWLNRVLSNSNLITVILTEIEPKHTELMNKFYKTAKYTPGSILFSASSTVAAPVGVNKITTGLKKDGSQLFDPEWLG